MDTENSATILSSSLQILFWIVEPNHLKVVYCFTFYFYFLWTDYWRRKFYLFISIFLFGKVLVDSTECSISVFKQKENNKFETENRYETQTSFDIKFINVSIFFFWRKLYFWNCNIFKAFQWDSHVLCSKSLDAFDVLC